MNAMRGKRLLFIRDDLAFRDSLSDLAPANSRRSEFDPEYQVGQLLRFVSTRGGQAREGGTR